MSSIDKSFSNRMVNSLFDVYIFYRRTYRHCYHSFRIVKSNMSSPSFRAPGEIVNEVYLEKIQSIIQLCSDVGDDPDSLIEQAKRELQVLEFLF